MCCIYINKISGGISISIDHTYIYIYVCVPYSSPNSCCINPDANDHPRKWPKCHPASTTKKIKQETNSW